MDHARQIVTLVPMWTETPTTSMNRYDGVSFFYLSLVEEETLGLW